MAKLERDGWLSWRGMGGWRDGWLRKARVAKLEGWGAKLERDGRLSWRGWGGLVGEGWVSKMRGMGG